MVGVHSFVMQYSSHRLIEKVNSLKQYPVTPFKALTDILSVTYGVLKLFPCPVFLSANDNKSLLLSCLYNYPNILASVTHPVG